MNPPWQVKRLGEVASIKPGNSAPQSKSLFRDGSHPFFRTSDVGRVGFGTITESADLLNDEGVRGLRQFPQGTVLFPKSGASTFLNHRVMLGVEGGYVASHLAGVIPKLDLIRPRFLLYALAMVDARDLVQDGAYPSLNVPTIESILVPLPTLDEQDRVVARLDEALNEVRANVFTIKRSLAAVEDLRIRHVETVFAARDDGWTEKPLGALAEFRNGLNFRKDSNGESVAIVGVKDFAGNFYVPLDQLDVVQVNGRLRGADILQPNDIVFVRSNGNQELIGRSLLVHQCDQRTSHSGFTIRARLTSDYVDPLYLCHYLKSETARRQMVAAGIGANIKSLSQGTLQKLTIPFPSRSLQQSTARKLDEFAEEAEHLSDIHGRRLGALDALRRSLLQAAMDGALAS